MQLYRQPSAGKIDNQNRQRFFQNFEQDLIMGPIQKG